MRKSFIAALCIPVLFLLTSCSPRDFLTRRLAADLIERSSIFRTPEQLHLRTGVISNADYLAPDYISLQHRGWISGVNKSCTQDISPPPCWDVTLTPAGVDAFQSLISPSDAEKQSFNIPAARRELIAVTGISKLNNSAQVEFIWKWAPLNEVGAAVYPGDQHYRSVASFRSYDDGWRLVQGTPHPVQSFDDALKNAEPAQ